MWDSQSRFLYLPDRGMPTNAIALSASLGTTARILGPAIGGIVVAVFSPGVAFGLNAVSYAIVIVPILAIRLAPRPPRTTPNPGILAGVRQNLLGLHGQFLKGFMASVKPEGCFNPSPVACLPPPLHRLP